MKEFLNRAMKRHEQGNSKKVEKFFEVFPKVTKRIVTELGEKPFHLRGPLNISALDSVMCVLVENYKKIDAKRLEHGYKSLSEDLDFLKFTQLGTTDTKTLQERVALVRKHLLD